MKFSKKMWTSDHDDGDNVGGGDDGGGDSGSDDCIAPLSRKVYGLEVLNLVFSELQSSKYTLGLQFWHLHSTTAVIFRMKRYLTGS